MSELQAQRASRGTAGLVALLLCALDVVTMFLLSGDGVATITLRLLVVGLTSALAIVARCAFLGVGSLHSVVRTATYALPTCFAFLTYMCALSLNTLAHIHLPPSVEPFADGWNPPQAGCL